MDKRGAKPKSRAMRVRNAPGAKRSERRVDYRLIDKGKSRPQVNRARREAAMESERNYWSAVDRDSQTRELQTLAAIHNPVRNGEKVRPTPPSREAKVPLAKSIASLRAPKEAKVKPAQKLGKAKSSFKGTRPTVPTANEPAPAKPKWSARDLRALARMKDERKNDRSRER